MSRFDVIFAGKSTIVGRRKALYVSRFAAVAFFSADAPHTQWREPAITYTVIGGNI